MSRNKLNIEELFRTEMEAVKVEPSPGLWRKVKAKMFWKQFFHFNFSSFNVYYLAAAVAVTAIGLVSNPGTNVQQASVAEPEMIQTPEVKQAIRTDRTEEQSVTESQPAEKAAKTLKTARKQVNEEKERQSAIKAKSAEGEENTGPETNGTEKAGDFAEASLDRKKKSEDLTVTAGFSSSVLEGCSPLAVDFRNTSENISEHTWIFGDGGSSTLMNPSYVFDEPGEYPVQLKLKGVDGLNYSVMKTIRVFETPKAQFEMDNEIQMSGERPVYFYNYSRGADYYRWEFGDTQSSELAEPMHFYENPGSYNVKLLVWTENQCFDSVTVMNAFTGTLSEINFPNAFTPNMSGPTGGSYETNDITNNVFHPIVTGELTEYQMKVFNRQGLLIFESNDVSFGWDGYIQESLAAQGVYIWKARGKFSNGQTFVKSGDVTLIRTF